jgi:dihydrofolate reductase
LKFLVEELLNELRAQPGKDISLFGGGELFRSPVAIAQVDTVEPAVIAVLLEYDVERAAGKRSADAKGGEGVAAR